MAVFVLLSTACKKAFLDASPNKSLAVPETLNDYQALMDNNVITSNNVYLGEASSDNYFVKPAFLQSQFYYYVNCYTWNSDTYSGGAGTAILDWNLPYANIYITNVVINGLNAFAVTPAQKANWNSIMGMALFYRAVAYFELAQEFAPPYDSSTAEKDMGLPLRLTADLDQPTSRASVQVNYSQILQDLLQAEGLLSQSVPALPYQNRPSKSATTAMLARVYLSMRDYGNAFKYADSSLGYYNTLMDYNTLNTALKNPYPNPNPESLVQIYETLTTLSLNASKNVFVDSTLYRSFDSSDLRKEIYFFIDPTTGWPYYHGTYTGTSYYFYGTAVDEEYLVRAECYARSGNVALAMEDLNTLLVTRWKTGTFTPRTASSSIDALNQILIERRKELCFRADLRWMDLRRLNKDPNFAITLTRVYNGQTYTLPPNDNRYTLMIPLDEIQLSGIEQNPR
jgi:hypothetical protein